MIAVAPRVWWWPSRREGHETADDVAERLNRVADELADTTAELRSLVTGLRAIRADREAWSASGRREDQL